MQSKKHSVLEAITNIVIGFVLNFIFNHIIFATLSIPVSHWQNVEIGIFFTFISLTRTYLIRRWWNNKEDKCQLN